METVVNQPSIFEDLFNKLAHPVLIFEVVDPALNNYRLFEVNDAACSLLRYSKEEFMTKDVLTLLRYVTPKVRRSVRDLLVENGQISTVLDLPDKNDVMTTVEVNASLVNLGTKQLVVCIIKDYSIRHCHHDALEEENTYLRTIIDTIQSFVLILDQEGRINNWNHYTEQHSGYTLEEVQDKKVLGLFHR